jgi:hypothetical protein
LRRRAGREHPDKKDTDTRQSKLFRKDVQYKLTNDDPARRALFNDPRRYSDRTSSLPSAAAPVLASSPYDWSSVRSFPCKSIAIQGSTHTPNT